MTVINNCKKVCAELRRKGFDENSETTRIIPEDAVINAVRKQKWSKITQLRYLGVTGYLVEHEFLEVVESEFKLEFRLTGEDRDD